jgi:hypothetical protein
MAVDSMLRRANRAQVGIQRLHDQALVGAKCSRVGIWLGLPISSKPDASTGTQRGKHHGLGHFGMIVLFMIFLFAFIRLSV